ncbi:MAG: heavy metal-associated domain-containing protein [Patescibacteria group bacterium]
MVIINFSLTGAFECQACTKLVSMELEEIPGVRSVEVNLDGAVRIESDREIDLAEIADALKGTDHSLAKE